MKEEVLINLAGILGLLAFGALIMIMGVLIGV